jgi:hypothetical protein
MTDDGGVLGGLPRSRPGRRSERRVTAPAGGVPASRAGGRSKPAARGARAAAEAEQPRSATARKAAAGAEAARAREEGAKGREGTGAPPARDRDDILTGTARAAVAVGEAGLRVASRLAGEARRRLPGP